MTSPLPLTFVGHPFASTGVGEQIRSHVRAAAAIFLEPQVYDVFRYAERTDPDHVALAKRFETPKLPKGIRVFHINGDEVDAVEEVLRTRGESFCNGYNVIVPAWELPKYPERWAGALRKFDEVWALSHFIADSLKAAGLSSTFIGQSVEPLRRPLFSRKSLGLRESAFVFLHFFDTTSFATRKNPQGALRLFKRLRDENPSADIQLALKVKTAEVAATQWTEALGAMANDVVQFDRVLTAFETQSLIDACDCFVSLHRSEGFGRGLGEAMAMGKIALGTNWSGNVDFMTANDSLPVAWTSVPLGPNDYPEGTGQAWAEPDLDDAFRLTNRIWADPARVAKIGAEARTAALSRAGHRAVGRRILGRVNQITETLKAS